MPTCFDGSGSQERLLLTSCRKTGNTNQYGKSARLIEQDYRLESSQAAGSRCRLVQRLESRSAHPSKQHDMLHFCIEENARISVLLSSCLGLSCEAVRRLSLAQAREDSKNNNESNGNDVPVESVPAFFGIQPDGRKSLVPHCRDCDMFRRFNQVTRCNALFRHLRPLSYCASAAHPPEEQAYRAQQGQDAPTAHPYQELPPQPNPHNPLEGRPRRSLGEGEGDPTTIIVQSVVFSSLPISPNILHQQHRAHRPSARSSLAVRLRPELRAAPAEKPSNKAHTVQNRIPALVWHCLYEGA